MELPGNPRCRFWSKGSGSGFRWDIQRLATHPTSVVSNPGGVCGENTKTRVFEL